ncbi:MAG: DUF1640 domain-containing protein [Gammaproteobacteria bacterium]|nr:DUF1640 domain-containing protein [Gammaproteobacteria bacterium]
MSHTIAFDTLKFVRRLEKSGIKQEQAEAIAHAMNDVFEENLSANIFTKQDGQLLTLEIENKLSKLETRLVLWFVGLLLMQNALVFGLFKLVH